jgi:hypothetical protein
MKHRSRILALVGALALAAATAYSPAASAGRVGFNVTVGGPGYGVTVGNYGGYYGPGYYGGYYGYYPPAPVVVAPPVPYYYRPYRAYAPVVVAPPYPVYRPYAAYRYRDDRHHDYRGHDRR